MKQFAKLFGGSGCMCVALIFTLVAYRAGISDQDVPIGPFSSREWMASLAIATLNFSLGFFSLADFVKNHLKS